MTPGLRCGQHIDNPAPAIVRQMLALSPGLTADDLGVYFADCEANARAAQKWWAYWGIEQDARLNRAYVNAMAAMPDEPLKTALVHSSARSLPIERHSARWSRF